jgi:hypothetical protein
MVQSLPWERLWAQEAGGDVNLSKSYGANQSSPLVESTFENQFEI